MNKGDNILITYKDAGNTRVLATFYESQNSIYLFRDSSGVFGVSEKKVRNGSITFDEVKDI